MKHLVAASILAASALAINACGTDVDLGSRPAYVTGTNTLTLFVYDGQSGAAITDAVVTVQIGAADETASVTNNTYTINGIPPGTFPITVAHDGYLTFTSASVNFASNGIVTSASTVPGTYVYTVSLFPTAAVSADVGVKVYEQADGSAVNNGQIVAILDSTRTITGNAGAGSSVGGANVKPLAGNVGLLPSSVSANIVNGVATLPHAQLVYGATYDLFVVGATNAQGQFVSTPTGTTPTLIAGQTSPNQLVLFVNGPNITPVALSANNEDANAITQNLQVNFPYTVVTCSDASTWSWVNNDAIDTTERPPTTGNKVNINIVSGTELQISPIIDPATVTAGDGVSVTFSGISVKVSGSDTCVGLGSVSLRGSGTDVSLKIIQSVKQ